MKVLISTQDLLNHFTNTVDI